MSSGESEKLQDTLKALLVEFHEHSVRRIPDLREGLAQVGKPAEEVPKGFDPRIPKPVEVPPELNEFISKVLTQYSEECEKLNQNRESIKKTILDMLNRQTLEGQRPVTLLEVEIHFDAIDCRFQVIAVMLKSLYEEWIRRTLQRCEDDASGSAGQPDDESEDEEEEGD